MMRFELGLEEPDAHRAYRSALTIAFAYIAGGFVPLFPYMLLPDNLAALKLSVIITLIALALFGAVKGKLVGSAGCAAPSRPPSSEAPPPPPLTSWPVSSTAIPCNPNAPQSIQNRSIQSRSTQ